MSAHEEATTTFLPELVKSIKEKGYHPKQFFKYSGTRLLQKKTPNRTYFINVQRRHQRVNVDGPVNSGPMW